MARSRLDALMTARAASRRRTAVERARAALDWLAAEGVEAAVVGSLARGTFREHSDVDVLILACPPHRKYTLETGVERHMGDLPFDVLYLDELPPPLRDRAEREAVRASDLR